MLTALEQVFRQEHGKVLAGLIRQLGDFDLAEDALQDAVAAALETWPRRGMPANPAAWLTTAARRKAIDRLRRARTLAAKRTELEASLRGERLGVETSMEEEDKISDDRLRLLFTACHPALALEARVALTLRTLGGLTTREIARAFLLPEPTLAQRLVRAKKKIRLARIPYRVPPPDLLAERLGSVLTVLYLVFNEGYLATEGDSLIRRELCAEAIRLAELLTELMPDEPEVLGLAALMHLHHSRRRARVGPAGELVVLEEQDRSLWDRDEIERGLSLLDRALLHRNPGPFQIQAAVSALHSRAPRPEATDWQQIAALYDALLRLAPSPVVELNRAAAVAMAASPAAGLALIDEIHRRGELGEYYLLHAARADLLRRDGRFAEAALSYQRAIERVANRAERLYLERRHREVLLGAANPSKIET